MTSSAKHSTTGFAKLALRTALAMAITVTFHASTIVAAPGDLLMKRDSAMAASSLPASIFPHWIHRINYRCDACHTRLFEMKSGAAIVKMADFKEQKYCGACHNGKQAFAVSFENCNRCHVIDADQ